MMHGRKSLRDLIVTITNIKIRRRTRDANPFQYDLVVKLSRVYRIIQDAKTNLIPVFVSFFIYLHRETRSRYIS